jgi:hypothetical protein
MPEALSEELANQASFVFRGTVQRVKAATMDQVPVNDRTAVVRVDEVLQAPEPLRDYAGQEITVQLGGEKPVKKGQHATFYANGWLFGDSLAVQAIDHTEESSKARKAAPETGDPAKALESTRLKARMDASDLVITGRVKSVRVPEGEPKGLTAKAAGEVDQRFSEHDPVWRIATVEVESVQKGRHAGKTVDVRFPSSTDVRWFHAPKLHPGQEGHFVLHGNEAPATKAMTTSGAETGDYVVLDAADFQPLEQPAPVPDAGKSPRGSRPH